MKPLLAVQSQPPSFIHIEPVGTQLPPDLQQLHGQRRDARKRHRQLLPHQRRETIEPRQAQTDKAHERILGAGIRQLTGHNAIEHNGARDGFDQRKERAFEARPRHATLQQFLNFKQNFSPAQTSIKQQ